VARRLQFDKPKRRGPGDPWFRVNGIDINTSLLIPIITVGVWIAYAISKQIITFIWLSRAAYRTGFIWQIVTWPFASAPDVRAAIGLFFFWSFGRMIEEQLGRLRYMRFLLINTVGIGLVALVIDAVIDGGLALGAPVFAGEAAWRFFPILVGPSLIALGAAVCVAVEYPGIQGFFGIPIRWMVGAFVAIEVLQTVADRAWIYLVYLAVAIVLSLMTFKAFGLGSELPKRFPALPLPASWTGIRPVGKAKLSSKQKRSKRGSGSVVTGPWGEQGTATATPPVAAGSMNRTDREEVDRLLDKIASSGMESLTKEERASLDSASRRLRDNGNR
jgi:membrane associated rhomboid family serine protease